MPKGSKKRSIVADTSALISLSIGDIIDECSELFTIVISTGVLDELKETSRFEDEHAMGASKVVELVDEGKIKVKEFGREREVSKTIKNHPKLDWGETESLLLAKEESIPIMITDDFKSLGSLKLLSKNVKINLSVYPIARLVIKRKISKEEARNTFEKIAKERSWEGAAIYRFAKKYLGEL